MCFKILLKCDGVVNRPSGTLGVICSRQSIGNYLSGRYWEEGKQYQVPKIATKWPPSSQVKEVAKGAIIPTYTFQKH